MLQLYYLTTNVDRALGVENLIPSYHIIHVQNSQLTIPISNAGVNIKSFPMTDSKGLVSSSKLLEDKSVLKYIEETTHNNPKILLFKNDSKITRLCDELGFTLLNPLSQNNKKFENKLSFSEYLDSQNYSNHPTYRKFDKLSDLNYTNVAKVFGPEFIVQFIFGHSGNNTFFIKSHIELEKLQKRYPSRQGKITQKIEGPTYTINACITSLGIVIGGISQQITGDPLYTSSPGGSIGNDFSQRHLTDYLRSELIEQTMALGNILQQHGHKGIFGLDFVLDVNKNKFYLIEANLRQVASCNFFSYLQQIKNQVPILLWHVLELINYDYEKRLDLIDEELEEMVHNGISKFRLSNDKMSLNLELNQPQYASEVIFRNTRDHRVKILDQFPAGIFRIRGRRPDESAMLEGEDEEYLDVYRLREDGWNTLCLKSRGYNIIDAKREDGFFVNFAPESSVIDPHGEMGRIQLLSSAFSSKNDTSLQGWINDTVNTIYENTRIIDLT